MISEIKQVVISIFILVFVYLLIGFEVGEDDSNGQDHTSISLAEQ